MMKSEKLLGFDQKSTRNPSKNVQKYPMLKHVFALRAPKVLEGLGTSEKHCYLAVRAGRKCPEPLRSAGVGIFDSDGTKSFTYEQMDFNQFLSSPVRFVRIFSHRKNQYN